MLVRVWAYLSSLVPSPSLSPLSPCVDAMCAVRLASVMCVCVSLSLSVCRVAVPMSRMSLFVCRRDEPTNQRRELSSCRRAKERAWCLAHACVAAAFFALTADSLASDGGRQGGQWCLQWKCRACLPVWLPVSPVCRSVGLVSLSRPVSLYLHLSARPRVGAGPSCGVVWMVWVSASPCSSIMLSVCLSVCLPVCLSICVCPRRAIPRHKYVNGCGSRWM